MGDGIRVSIVDDDALVRLSLRVIIERLSRYELVSTHDSALDALSVLPGMKPDIVLLDIRMPGMSGIECARQLIQKLPSAKLMMVTAYLEEALIAEAFRAGAIGYVLKPFTPETIGNALDCAERGVIHLEGVVSERFSAWLRARRSAGSPELSEREVEVLECVRQGMSDKEIAARLSLSEHTVKSHVRKILGKLKTSSRSGAVSIYFSYF
jgi:DNA-binding NarL/FixJ family response regulator